MVAFFVTIGASVYIATSSQISASTVDSSKTILYSTVAITNYLNTEMPSSMWKCQAYEIKYFSPTTTAGPSGQLSANSVLTEYRNEIYNAFKSANPGLVFYDGQAEIQADVDKCAKNDTQACARVKKGVLKTALKPTCDSVKAYDIAVVNPNIIYSATTATTATTTVGSTTSSTGQKTVAIKITDKSGKLVNGAKIIFSYPDQSNPGHNAGQTIPTDDGTYSLTIKADGMTPSANLYFYATYGTNSSDIISSPEIKKAWQDIKSSDTINLVFDKALADSTAPLTSKEKNNPFIMPTGNSSTGAVKVTNSKTKRVLGGVNITIQSTTDAKNIATTVTHDPPKPEGESIEKFSDGTYTVVAKRYGYEIYQATANVGSTNQYFNIDIAMVPLAGLPDPDLQFQSTLSSSLSNTNLSNLGGSVIPLISQLLQYTNQNENNSNFNNYPYNGQNGNGSVFNGSLNQNSDTSTFNNFPYQTGYSNNTAQTAVVPIVLSIQPQYPLNTTSQNVRFEIYDASTGTSIINTTFDMSQLATQISSTTGSIIRYGCLNPNYSQYALKVTNLSNSALSVGPYQFTSGSSGQAVVISVPVQSGSALLNNIGYRVVDKSSLSLDNFTCPSNSLTSAINGQNAWTGAALTDTQIRSYAVFQYTDGKYYMVNTTLGSTDIRPIVFVMSQGSTGGLAFVSAASGLNITASSQSGWYVTTFTLVNNVPVIDRSKLSRVDISPSDYATAIHSQITDGFNGNSPTSASGTSSSITDGSSLISGANDLYGTPGNENYRTPPESSVGGQGMAQILPIGQWNLDSGPDDVWGQSKDANIPSSPQRAFLDNKYPSGTYVIAVIKWHAINNETDRQAVYKLIPANLPSASIRCSFNGTKTLICGTPVNSSQVEILPMYSGVVKASDYWAITLKGLFSGYTSADKGYWFIKKIA